MKKILSITILSCLFSTTTFAIYCPSPTEIRNAEYNVVELDGDGTHFVNKQGYFGTSEMWDFYLTKIQAKSANDALDKMEEALNRQFRGDQFPSRDQGSLRCNYYDTGYPAFAIMQENAK
jgi:hypothetical protein